MAKNSVIIKTDPSTIKYVEGGHNYNISNQRLELSAYIPKDSSVQTRHEETYFIVPLNLPNVCEITSIKFPKIEEYTNDDLDQSTCYLIINQSYYYVSLDGSVSSGAINNINSYKEKNGYYPELTLRVSTYLYGSPAYEAYAKIIFSPPEFTCLINGGTHILRPVIDRAKGHEIPAGFSSVYDLLDEVNADDEITAIKSVAKGSGEIDQTSVVEMTYLENEKLSIVQVRLFARLCMTDDTNSNSLVKISVSPAQGNKITFTQESSGIYQRWENNKYYTFEAILPASFVNDLNDYYHKYQYISPINVHLQTKAWGYTDNKNKNYEASAEVSQVYLEVVYIKGMNVYKKIDSEYKKVSAAYQKENNVWVEIGEAQCREIIKNNSIWQE